VTLQDTAARDVLRTVFGYDDFRGDQAEIVDHLVSGHDCLVLMPTGGGKSLCYQIPSIVRPGTGVVVSPLIALMQDQVVALRQLGVKAEFLNSSLQQSEQRTIEQRFVGRDLDLLYVAPERLLKDRFLDLLERAEPALFAIDEAHCVSMWGHDFRPEYRQLKILHERFGGVPRIALTATADEPTRADIVEHLSLRGARRFVASFDRPNIRYRVVTKKAPLKQLLGFLSEHRGESGIIYRFSRRNVEETANDLQTSGYNAIPYHAGLDAQTRRRHQARFVKEEGVIVVATIAFGMGIDKPDVRFVVHLDLPRSVEGYYQETGRAGRDGLASDALLIYGMSDVGSMQNLIDQGNSNEERKRVERQKLSQLLGYCESISCRRQSLLAHFGEAHPGECGNCDNCLHPPTSWDGTIAAQKALSCVYRTGERFGVSHLIDVLLGRDTEKVQQHGHTAVSTFGIGLELAEQQWRSVFRQLMAAGYLRTDAARYGGLRLLPAANAVLKGEHSVTFREDTRVPKQARTRKPVVPRSFGDVTPEDVALWEALRALRSELAKEQGVPPYVIFHDATLRDIVERRPATLEEFASVNGVGAAKLERYGTRFLEVLTAAD
jgi:ATP-dependent DNA helicase RecQ